MLKMVYFLMRFLVRFLMRIYKLVKKVLPDLVLSDLVMPRMGGDGLLAAIKGDQRLASIPVDLFLYCFHYLLFLRLLIQILSL